MTTSTPDATGAPSQIKLGDKTYFLYPLDDADMGQFERWAQDRMIDVAIRNLSRLEREADRSSLLQHAYDKAAKVTVGSRELLSLFASFDGLVFLVWLSFRRNDPNLSQEEVVKLISKHADQLPELTDRFKRLNPRPEEKAPAPPGKGPRPPGKKLKGRNRKGRGR